MNNTTELPETGECSFNNCYTEQKFIFIREVQITFLVLYGLVSIIGTVGNLFIVITVVRTPSLHTGINLFVCNMAVSDMMMCLTAAPLTPITSFTGRWFLGQLPCVLLPGCQGVSVYISTLSLTAIALDRLNAVTRTVTRPSINQTENRKTVFKIVLINVVSVLAILPYSLHMEWSVESGVEDCVEVWSGLTRKMFGMFTFLLQFLLPSLVSAFAYVRIIIVLRRHIGSHNHTGKSNQRRLKDEKRNIRRSHLLITTVTLFVVCWLPLNILNLGEDLDLPLKSWRYYYFSFFCFHLVAMSSTICNMLVYGWLNENIASQSHIFRDIRTAVARTGESGETLRMEIIPDRQ